MNYLNRLREIDSYVFETMGKTSQKTIDFVEDTIRDLDREIDDNPIERDELGAINYEISVLLEVWNPSLEHDISVLKRFDKIIREWYEKIEFVNITLGITKEKG